MFVVFVGVEYVMATACWEIGRWLPLLACPPRIHVLLWRFGYFGYLGFYLLACTVVHLSELMWRDRI